jgi:hypothetical protein
VAQLSFEDLNLRENRNYEIRSSGRLRQLTTMWPGHNRIADISAQAAISKLNLRNNPIIDISSLAPLKNASISLYGNDNIPCAQMDQFTQVFRPKKCRK